LKITFLGTGTSQGVPVIGCDCEACSSSDARDDRLRSAIHVDINGLSIVIDIGPDFRQQMLRYQVKRLDAIFITHEHNDHVIGLDDIRAFNFLQRSDIPLYTEARVITALNQRFSYVFGYDKYPGVPKVTTHTITGNQQFSCHSIDIMPVRVMHGNLPIVGFRIGDFSYITDASHIDDASKDLIKNSKVLVLNALRREAHHSHFTQEQAIKMAEELCAETTYLTHISHHMGKTLDWEQELPLHVIPACDGMVITIEDPI